MKSLQEHLNEALFKSIDVDIKLTDISKLKIGDYVSDGHKKPYIYEISQIISLKPIKVKIVKSNSNNPVGKIIDIESHGGPIEMAKVLNPGKVGLK